MANNQFLHSQVLDDYDLIFGTDTDIKLRYDETTNDRLDFRDGADNTLAYLKDLGTTGLLGVTGRLEAPQIGIAADTDLVTLAANLVTVGGKIDALTGIVARQSFIGGNQYAGVTPSEDYPVYIYNRPTNTSSTYSAIRSTQEPSPSGASSGSFHAVTGSVRVVSNQTVSVIRAFDTNIQTGTGTSVATSADSLRAAITNNGVGTIISYRGVRVTSSGSTGVVTNFYGLDVEANTSSGANAIGATVKYGLRIGAISGAATTNKAIETSIGAVEFGDLVYVKQGGASAFVKIGGVVYQNSTAVGNVGSGEDDLMSASIAASTLGTNGDSLCFSMTFTTAANANNKTIKVKYGATTLWDSTAVAANDQRVRVRGRITRTGAATQIAVVEVMVSGGYTATVVTSSPTETLSGAVTLKATGEATSDNDVQQLSMNVNWEPANT